MSVVYVCSGHTGCYVNEIIIIIKKTTTYLFSFQLFMEMHKTNVPQIFAMAKMYTEKTHNKMNTN